MSTASLLRVESTRSEQTARTPAGRQQTLTEGACLTCLAVLGGLLCLALLLVVVKLLYFALTMQNGKFVMPLLGVS